MRFKSVTFGNKHINSFQMLTVLFLALIPYVKWAVITFALYNVLSDILLSEIY